jgi:hypothetical protein
MWREEEKLSLLFDVDEEKVLLFLCRLFLLLLLLLDVLALRPTIKTHLPQQMTSQPQKSETKN